MRGSVVRIRRLTSLVLPALALCGAGVASARPGQAQRLRTVEYRGYVVTVPRSWPVFNLAKDPAGCVRFDRHAVYLGLPSARQRCPAHAAGRTGAILLEPAGAAAARVGSTASPLHLEGSAASFVIRAGTVRVLATWGTDRGLISRALHHVVRASAGDAAGGAHPTAQAASARARSASVSAHAAGAAFTGLGFDACSAPSSRAMAAWGSAPYHAIGIYIGGTNAACSQPNLTAGWVTSEVAAGWHLIPTYVGLQAPSNSCGCAAIKATQASSEGVAAADDAVTQAQSLAIPAGNPIYDDMESYPRGGSNTSAVLAFLAAWTSELHAKGYLSGVYSSAGSGISDLVGAYGTSYREPDDIWIGDWNGQQTTNDPYVPSGDWPSHRRLHQYRGGHNETYGGVTINIDSNYLDGATADTGGAGSAQAPAPPSLVVSAGSDGTTHLTAAWNTGNGLTAWRVLAGTSRTSLSTITTATAKGSRTSIGVRSAAAYFAVQAVGSASQILANSSTIAAPPHLILFGHSAFVNQGSGVGGIPAGCYVATTCHLTTTLSSGRTTVARTGTESIPANGTGILYFRLSPAGRRLLAHAPGARLPVRLTTYNATGNATTAGMNLISFSTSGRGPSRSSTPSPLIQTVGGTDFVFARGAGGILSRCGSVAACRISARLSVGRVTVATTRPEIVGGHELGYVLFTLTARGRVMLAQARGNQLAVNVALSSGSSVARARLALVQFG